MGYKNWTLGEEDTLRTMRLKGYPVREIAIKLGRTERSVCTHLQKINLSRSESWAYHRWTDKEREKLFRIILEENSWKEIAKRMDTDMYSIKGYLYRQLGTGSLEKVKAILSEDGKGETA